MTPAAASVRRSVQKYTRGPATIFRGVESPRVPYTSDDFQRLLADQGITCSMSRKGGDVWDNAEMESFFSSLRQERVSRRRYRSRDDARADLLDYIERFYNPRRHHARLGNVSPMECEPRITS